MLQDVRWRRLIPLLLLGAAQSVLWTFVLPPLLALPLGFVLALVLGMLWPPCFDRD